MYTYYDLLLQKRKERTSALVRNQRITEEARQKWLKMVTNEMMSSEESGDDDTIIVHSLPWRSDYVTSMFKKIDEYSQAKKSPQSRRQMKGRRMGSLSNRSAPPDLPAWAIK